MSLRDAFRSLLHFRKRAVTIGRPGGDGLATFITPSNFSRQTFAPADMVIKGRQFIITKENADILIDPIRRGDTIVDTELGTLTIKDVEEMFDESAKIIGYRITTG